jgi:hypothetical protein
MPGAMLVPSVWIFSGEATADILDIENGAMQPGLAGL